MEIRQLASFVAVAQHGSFTRAATELAYAQSTVTSHVQALEKMLRAELFDRLPGTVKLTRVGERLLPYAVDILELSRSARRVADFTEYPSGTLIVGSMDSLTSYRLLPLVQQVQLNFPEMQLAFRPGLCADTHDAVRNAVFDCGFVIDARTEFAGLRSKVLCEEPLSLIASPEHRLAKTAVVRTADLREALIVGTEKGCAYRDLFEEELSASGEVNILELNTVDAIKRVVADGSGIALLPRVTCTQDLAAGSLVELSWRPPFRVYTQALWRAQQLDNPAVRTLLDTAAALIEGQRREELKAEQRLAS